jgi:hypothetical protein
MIEQIERGDEHAAVAERSETSEIELRFGRRQVAEETVENASELVGTSHRAVRMR